VQAVDRVTKGEGRFNLGTTAGLITDALRRLPASPPRILTNRMEDVDGWDPSPPGLHEA
jgi:hypothetical protein